VPQRVAELGVADAVFDVGAMTQPRLDRHRVVGQAGQDHGVAVDPVELAGGGAAERFRVDGAPPAAARVGGELAGGDGDAADDRPGHRRPSLGPGGAGGDLRVGHAHRRPPGVGGHGADRPPQRRAAARADGEVAADRKGGGGQVLVEEPGVGPQAGPANAGRQRR
jgi:hypothetical protein